MAICRIVTGSSARLNEAEGGDIWWRLLGNSVWVGWGCGEEMRISTHTHTHKLIHEYYLIFCGR